MPLEIFDTRDNASLFKNTYTPDDLNNDQLKEDSISFEVPFGKANMQQWRFTGIRMAHSHWDYHQIAETEWKGDLEVVTVYFNLQGECTITPEGIAAPMAFSPGQCNIFYSAGGSARIKNIDKESTSFILQFTKDAFLRITQSNDTLLGNFRAAIEKGNAIGLTGESLYMPQHTLMLIQQVITCDHSAELKKMLFQAKAIELLVAIITLAHQSLNKTGTFLKKEYDKQRVAFVREVLLKNMQHPPSLPQLAKIAGINEQKLKIGFKEMFGETVFGYLSTLRLKTAEQMLMNGHTDISDLAHQLGYSSGAHFSAAFKKKFGTTPGAYARKLL